MNEEIEDLQQELNEYDEEYVKLYEKYCNLRNEKKDLQQKVEQLEKELEQKEAILGGIQQLEYKCEQLENIRKEAITYILAHCEIIRHINENVDEVGNVNGGNLLNILNKGSDKEC